MRNIVIATDGSPAAQAAVADGLKLARDHRARVTIVTVRSAPMPVLGDPYYERALSRELARAHAAVDKALAMAEDFGVEADAEVVEGDPSDEIVRFARARDADLIVVGSRDRPLAGAILGSVSRAVVREADMPVLVAKHRVPARAVVHSA